MVFSFCKLGNVNFILTTVESIVTASGCELDVDVALNKWSCRWLTDHQSPIASHQVNILSITYTVASTITNANNNSNNFNTRYVRVYFLGSHKNCYL